MKKLKRRGINIVTYSLSLKNTGKIKNRKMSLRITVFLFLKIFPEKLDARRKEKLKREGGEGKIN